MAKIGYKRGRRVKWVSPEPPPPPFSPGDLSTLEGWFDVTDAGSVVLSGSNVTQLTDKSGKGRHMSTSNARPTYSATGGANNLAYMRVLGSSNQDLNSSAFTAIPQPYTVYLVCKQTSFVDGKFLFGLDNGNGAHISYNAMSFGNIIGLNAGATYGRKVNGVRNTWQILCSTFNGVYSRFSVNNEGYRRGSEIGSAPEGTCGGTSCNRFNFGPYYKMSDIDVHEVIIISESPSAATDKNIRDYLTAKYSPAPNPFFIWWGDSITTGAICTDYNRDGFYKLVSDHFAADNVNFAYSGSVAAATAMHPGQVGNNFEDRYQYVLNQDIDISDFWHMYGYGTNDQTPDAAWKATYKSCLQAHINAGAQTGKMILVGPPYHSAGLTAAQPYLIEIATELGINFFNAHVYMSTRGGSSLMDVDGIHPNDSGHSVIADGLIELIEGL